MNTTTTNENLEGILKTESRPYQGETADKFRRELEKANTYVNSQDMQQSLDKCTEISLGEYIDRKYKSAPKIIKDFLVSVYRLMGYDYKTIIDKFDDSFHTEKEGMKHDIALTKRELSRIHREKSRLIGTLTALANKRDYYDQGIVDLEREQHDVDYVLGVNSRKEEIDPQQLQCGSKFSTMNQSDLNLLKPTFPAQIRDAQNLVSEINYQIEDCIQQYDGLEFQEKDAQNDIDGTYKGINELNANVLANGSNVMPTSQKIERVRRAEQRKKRLKDPLQGLQGIKKAIQDGAMTTPNVEYQFGVPEDDAYTSDTLRKMKQDQDELFDNRTREKEQLSTKVEARLNQLIGPRN